MLASSFKVPHEPRGYRLKGIVYKWTLTWSWEQDGTWLISNQRVSWWTVVHSQLHSHRLDWSSVALVLKFKETVNVWEQRLRLSHDGLLCMGYVMSITSLKDFRSSQRALRSLSSNLLGAKKGLASTRNFAPGLLSFRWSHLSLQVWNNTSQQCIGWKHLYPTLLLVFPHGPLLVFLQHCWLANQGKMAWQSQSALQNEIL